MKKKTEFRYFTISDWEQEEKYLRSRHQEGWKLTGVTLPGFYHFEECEPEDVVYRLDYNKEAEKEEAEYHQLFQDCGWEYVLKFVGYSYFRKKAAESDDVAGEEIFGDDESKLEMCRRVIRGRMLPLLAIFCLILLPQMIRNIGLLMEGDSDATTITVIYGVLLAIYCWTFATFSYHYYRVKRGLR